MTARRASEDPRYKHLQEELSDQQKQLASTREEVENRCTDLKNYQRVGSISLSLPKVDFKKKHYDLAMRVDDFELQKKNVNLFEPIWITIKGYISEPKYKKSELAASTAAPAAKTQ